MTKISAILNDFCEHGRSDSCPIIDMHGHYGAFCWVYMPRSNGHEMIDSMDRQGVKALVLSSHTALFHDVDAGNDLTRAVVRRYPGRFYGYVVVNPNFPASLQKELAQFQKGNGFLGFKLLPDYHQHPITGAKYAPVLEYADRHQLCVLAHTWGFSPHDGPALVAEVAKRYPNITFFMGHSGYGEWETSIAVARDYDNVYLELTATYATHEGIVLKWCPEENFGIGVNGIIEQMVEGAGSEKILFGTDLPWYSPHYAAGAILYSHISETDVHNIFHKNAERIFAKAGMTL